MVKSTSLGCTIGKRTIIEVLSAMVGRDEFPAFPYEPYSVQRDFMQNLYSLLETGGVGLFESPTGIDRRLKKPFVFQRYMACYRKGSR